MIWSGLPPCDAQPVTVSKTCVPTFPCATETDIRGAVGAAVVGAWGDAETGPVVPEPLECVPQATLIVARQTRRINPNVDSVRMRAVPRVV